MINLMDGVYAYPESVADPTAASAVIEAMDALIEVRNPKQRARPRAIGRM
jgi:hypothetical protein